MQKPDLPAPSSWVNLFKVLVDDDRVRLDFYEADRLIGSVSTTHKNADALVGVVAKTLHEHEIKAAERRAEAKS